MWEAWDLNCSKENWKQTLGKRSFWWQHFWRLWIYAHCKFLKATQINICQECLGCVYSCSRQWYRPCDSSASALCDLLSWEVNERRDQGWRTSRVWKAQWEQFVEWLWWHKGWSKPDPAANQTVMEGESSISLEPQFQNFVGISWRGCGASLSCFSSSFCFWFLKANFVQLCAVSFLSLRW